MTEPRTAAGRALASALMGMAGTHIHAVDALNAETDILAIEAEARAAALDEARAAVEAAPYLPERASRGDMVEYRGYVLAAIDALREGADAG